MDEAVIGIDLGTQGARVLVVNPKGEVVASAHAPFTSMPGSLPAGWFEQDPLEWWRAVRDCLLRAMNYLSGTRIVGISVDSTSGTVLPVDLEGEPLHPAVMYNDQRSEAQAAQVREFGRELEEKLSYRFGSSYGLPKILWFLQAEPQVFERARWFIHAADFINGRLTGSYSFTDTSNALKTGYDLIELTWPGFIEEKLRIPLEKLPQVFTPGTRLGTVSSQAEAETGLPAGIPVYAGATDGTAAQIASGASHPGDWNSSLGTTLVLKGVCEQLIPDPLGRIYYHLHPDGYWMPGGASNTGSSWITQEYAGADLPSLDLSAQAYLPSQLVRYPLARRGERFPFIHPRAEGFLLGTTTDSVELYAAGLEGLAMVERLAYETVQQLGLAVAETIFTTGGGSKSATWSKVRASVLHKNLARPAVTESAMGAAILAGSGCWYASLGEASQAMVCITDYIEPNREWIDPYEQKYQQFKQELIARGYIPEAAGTFTLH